MKPVGTSTAATVLALALALVGARSLLLPRLGAPAHASHASATNAALRLDINTASAVELTAVPGLGPVLAERIVADRQVRGPFRSVEDLQRVPRIGPVLVEQTRAFVVVRR